MLAFFGCKEDEQVLPERTLNGTITIEGIDYQVNYGMLNDAGPDGNGLRSYRLALSDNPIGWDENGQYFSKLGSGFRINIQFLTFEDGLEQGRYEFWSPEDFPEDRWWALAHLSFSKEHEVYDAHPNEGAVVMSELDGDYSFIFNLIGNSESQSATIKGTVFGELPVVIEN